LYNICHGYTLENFGNQLATTYFVKRENGAREKINLSKDLVVPLKFKDDMELNTCARDFSFDNVQFENGNIVTKFNTFKSLNFDIEELECVSDIHILLIEKLQFFNPQLLGPESYVESEGEF
jgi:hypothetical protein